MLNNDISYEKSISEFEEIFKNMKNLKRKIEEEIEKINNSQEKIEEEISLSFKKKHLKLDEKEKNLRLELNTKVNNIKEELEDYLKKSKNIILSLNNIQELIENYENKNNEIKTLYYISEINKNKEKGIEFLNKKIKNLNISMYLDNSAICYENYYFNGIPIPKNVKVEEKDKKLYISWIIYDSMMKGIDIKNIKYSVFIKDNNGELKFESSNKYFYYNYYNEDYEYEIKVRTMLDYCYSDWSEVIKFKKEKQVKNENSKITLNLFNNKKDDDNKESKPIFTNIFNNDNSGGLFGKNNNKEKGVGLFTNSIFGNNQKKEETSLFRTTNNLFSSAINENKDSSVFGNINDKVSLFGNNNKTEFHFKDNNIFKNIFDKNNDNNKEIKPNDKNDNL